MYDSDIMPCIKIDKPPVRVFFILYDPVINFPVMLGRDKPPVVYIFGNIMQ